MTSCAGIQPAEHNISGYSIISFGFVVPLLVVGGGVREGAGDILVVLVAVVVVEDTECIAASIAFWMFDSCVVFAVAVGDWSRFGVWAAAVVEEKRFDRQSTNANCLRWVSVERSIPCFVFVQIFR